MKRAILAIEKEIEKSKKLFDKAVSQSNYSRMSELTSYTSGLQFALEILKICGSFAVVPDAKKSNEIK